MNVLFTTLWIVSVSFHAEGKRGQDSDVDHEDVGSIDYTNASFYTTSEMRDKVLAEWKGKTEEIQGYFDQLPSEEFKENSEDRKFKFYWERKGVKDIDTNQVFNITPHQYREPPGPMYTIEVNDSYVPKYRITPSEEERMDKYGTFNSVSTSSEDSSEEVTKKKKKKKKKGSSESGGGKAKKKKDKKAWPSNMDPKEKRKKKKPRNDEEEKKRKDLVEKNLNGVRNSKLNIKKIQGDKKQEGTNQEMILSKKLLQGNKLLNKNNEEKNFLNKKTISKIKQRNARLTSSNQKSHFKNNKSKDDHKLLNNEEIEKRIENFERQQKRSKQTIRGNYLRPYL